MSDGECLVLLLQYLEEPDVLDGNDRLVGERLDKLDLPVRKGPDFGPPDRNHPRQCALPEHWDTESRSNSSQLVGGDPVLGIRENVRDVDGPALDRGTPGSASTVGAVMT